MHTGCKPPLTSGHVSRPHLMDPVTPRAASLDDEFLRAKDFRHSRDQAQKPDLEDDRADNSDHVIQVLILRQPTWGGGDACYRPMMRMSCSPMKTVPTWSSLRRLARFRMRIRICALNRLIQMESLDYEIYENAMYSPLIFSMPHDSLLVDIAENRKDVTKAIAERTCSCAGCSRY
jgi:hypothetical protein